MEMTRREWMAGTLAFASSASLAGAIETSPSEFLAVLLQLKDLERVHGTPRYLQFTIPGASKNGLRQAASAYVRVFGSGEAAPRITLQGSEVAHASPLIATLHSAQGHTAVFTSTRDANHALRGTARFAEDAWGYSGSAWQCLA